MVPVRMMQEILDLKAKGFSVNEIFDYLVQIAVYGGQQGHDKRPERAA